MEHKRNREPIHSQIRSARNKYKDGGQLLAGRQKKQVVEAESFSRLGVRQFYGLKISGGV